jgi:hypothetical protein
MDGSQSQQGPQVDVEARVRDIKAYMPETYKAIQAKAAEIGRPAYAYVRRGLAGQPNMFWAVERGRVVGAPFNLPEITADVAQLMVAFGCNSVVMWGEPAAQQGAADGAH